MFKSVLLAVCALALSVHSQAATATTVLVNPESIRTNLIESNTSVLTSLNQLYQAKEQVNKARASLFPSLGLTATLGGQPNFALSTINILLPFLLPANWHAVDATKQQLAANGYAYQLVALNDYASALAIYSQVVGDMSLREVYADHLKNLLAIVEIVRDEVVVGTATPADLAQAEAQAQLAQVQISQVDELIAREKATMRQMMGLSLDVDLVVQPSHVDELPEETSTARILFDRISDSSPERRQIESLIAAAKAAKYQSVWSFLTGSGLSVSPDFGSSSFGHLTGTASVSLGFGIFPAIQLSNLNIAQLKIRSTEIDLEEGEVLESTLASLEEAQRQVALALQARENYQIALEAEKDKYRTGKSDLLNVLTVSQNALGASTTYVRALADLDSQRVGLQRVLITGPFAKIPTCRLGGAERKGGIFGFLKGIFKKHGSRYASIDEMCRPAASAAARAAGH